MILTYFFLKFLFDTEGIIINTAYLIESNVLSLVVSIVFYFIQSRMDMSNIRGQFASKVSKQVMEDLLDTSKKVGDTSSKRKDVTIFFSDIKSFTKITETIDNPVLLTKFINRYMDAMTKSIMLNEGTVDKFMGDAIMAYWNAPYDVENHADKALTSAIQQIELLDEINEMNRNEDMPEIEIRIGMTYGEAFVGEVCGELRRDYTIMGKNVNHAAVLEQVGKYYYSNLIISQSVKDHIRDDYVMQLIDIIQIDGTSDAFNIYQVIKTGKADEFLNDQIEEFEKAIQFYRRAKFTDSILLFRSLNTKEDLINKKLCNTYIKRCEHELNSKGNTSFSAIQFINKSLISSS
jgi:adenylate cyclase